jgi:hypothetical protein
MLINFMIRLMPSLLSILGSRVPQLMLTFGYCCHFLSGLGVVQKIRVKIGGEGGVQQFNTECHSGGGRGSPI